MSKFTKFFVFIVLLLATCNLAQAHFPYKRFDGFRLQAFGYWEARKIPKRIERLSLVSLADRPAIEMTFLSFHDKVAMLAYDPNANLSTKNARALASFHGHTLTLDLHDPATEVARKIAKFKGDCLELDFYDNPSVEAAKAFATFKGEMLEAKFREKPTIEVLKALFSFGGKTLKVRIPNNLQSDIASAIAAFGGNELKVVCGKLTVEALKALSGFGGSSLSVTEHSAEHQLTALHGEEIAAFNGDHLKLRLRKQPDEDFFKALTKSFCGLTIDAEILDCNRPIDLNNFVVNGGPAVSLKLYQTTEEPLEIIPPTELYDRNKISVTINYAYQGVPFP